MRPFKVGDLVVCTKNDAAYTIDRILYADNKDRLTELWMKEGGYVFDDCIKTIRSPRHGTAKERRMVAVLAREYHKIRLHNFYLAISDDLQNGTEKEKTKQKEFWESVRNGSRFCNLRTKNHYDKLKAMLKED